MNYILKTAKDEANVIVWQALYHHGRKQVEATELNLEKVATIFEVTEPIHHVNVSETFLSNIGNAFPEQENFSYLLDHTSLSVGMTVYFETGKYVVSKTWEEYRPSGLYPIETWYAVGNSLMHMTQETFYSGHQAMLFQVEGSDDIYTWDDVYANNQSTFYDYLVDKKNI